MDTGSQRSETKAQARLSIKVSGTVQGVGFRPYVYGLATGLGLRGYVANTADGVVIDVEGGDTETFLRRLPAEAPPLARIAAVQVSRLEPRGYDGFHIVQSRDGGSFTLISPDVSVCGDCLRELLDPRDRRYRYPFINCTNCGPRYSITLSTPYDRPNTTMAVFAMCPECERDYTDPADRRFHAEPNACPACGPSVELRVKAPDGAWHRAEEPDPIRAAAALLRAGRVVAVKGLGGFHLASDAQNREAVETLRRRKRRSNKPFALMAPDVESVRRFCHVSDQEEALLHSEKRPIVLLRKKVPCPLPEALAPGNTRLGFMLPYTPLHYLLLAHMDAPLVMTSGNLSEEPIQVDNAEAMDKLAELADASVLHNRDIFMRVDDSVLKVAHGSVFPVRRARGYTPEPIPLHQDGPDVLAAGADIKNTFTLLKGPYAIVSQHIGDMENYETLRFFEETLENLKAVYRAAPRAIAHDLHPGYLSTQWALRQEARRLPVQHHHAHIASVMAERGVRDKVIGVALDGTGYGADGTLWGGEFLVADPLGYERVGHLKAVPLPGGEMAVREPWRTAVSYLKAAAPQEAEEYLTRLGFFHRYGPERVNGILKILDIREVSPLSSGAGRLFDAVSALLGVCGQSTFEGEAAMALEAEAAEDVAGEYPVDIAAGDVLEVDFSPAVLSVVGDFLRGVGRDVIAARFHNTVIEAVLRAVGMLVRQRGIRTVALSGGVFQNDYLMGGVRGRLRAEGLTVHTNESVPLNDAGISLGQAYILRETLRYHGELQGE